MLSERNFYPFIWVSLVLLLALSLASGVCGPLGFFCRTSFGWFLAFLAVLWTSRVVGGQVKDLEAETELVGVKVKHRSGRGASVPWPFARISLTKSRLVVSTLWGSYSLLKEEVVVLKREKGGHLSLILRHEREDLPELILVRGLGEDFLSKLSVYRFRQG